MVKKTGHSLRSVSTYGRKSGHWVSPYAIMKHCTLTSAYFILQDTKTVELCDGYAMTTCAWYFATSCRKVTGHWKRGSIDTGIEVKVRARNI